ncbi:MAG TPA: hypothetical protein VFC74_04980 [Oscillospiraceae bacterium]|nr:hypothetical protein [Oscillospiraceae bacterium]
MKKASCILLVLVSLFVLVGCSGGKTPANADPIKMGRVEHAAHGTKCFAVAVVAVQGDTIVGASLDEYQFMSTDVATGVPNADADFAKNFADPAVVLASKRANADYYSEHMTEAAGATKRLDEQYDTIEAYVVGKTVAELESTLSENDGAGMIDAVSSVTLVDTKGYVEALVAAAKAAK